MVVFHRHHRLRQLPRRLGKGETAPPLHSAWRAAGGRARAGGAAASIPSSRASARVNRKSPQATEDNSPALQRWVQWPPEVPVPQGRQKAAARSFRPCGTGHSDAPAPSTEVLGYFQAAPRGVRIQAGMRLGLWLGGGFGMTFSQGAERCGSRGSYFPRQRRRDAEGAALLPPENQTQKMAMTPHFLRDLCASASLRLCVKKQNPSESAGRRRAEVSGSGVHNGLTNYPSARRSSFSNRHFPASRIRTGDAASRSRIGTPSSPSRPNASTPVGHCCTQAEQRTHSGSSIGIPLFAKFITSMP